MALAAWWNWTLRQGIYQTLPCLLPFDLVLSWDGLERWISMARVVSFSIEKVELLYQEEI